MTTPEIDISQLSEAQQVALQQYTSVTDQDIQAALPILQRSQWNVEIAIAKFFDGDRPDPFAEALAAQQAPLQRTARLENLQESLGHGSRRARGGNQSLPDPAPRIVPQDVQVIQRPSFLFAILYTPFSLLYKSLSAALRLFSYIFPFLPRVLRSNPANGTQRPNTAGRRSLRPRDSAARMKREFEEEFGSSSLPFYEGGYAQALDLAKKHLKFLLVVLMSPEHDDTSSFIRETLLFSEVQAFISNPSNNIILWVGDVRDSEAYQVSTALGCSKFPFTAVIAHTPQISSTAMSVIARLSGPMPPSAYLAKLQNTLTSHSEQLATVRAARSAQHFERNLRQEQDSAYERSLAQDRERARLRREAEAATAEQERRAREEATAAASLAQNRIQWRRWRAVHIAAEPSPDSKDVVRIALKMPEAARITRRFRGDAAIEELYSFVECYDYVKDGAVIESIPKPEGYEHKFQFRLVSTLPRVVYEPDEDDTIVERVGKSGNLIVEPLSVESEE